MYESPINAIVNDICIDLQKKEDKYIMECVRDVGINVNKHELLKALSYDRNQYEKGYKDGLNKVCDILNEIFGTPCDYTINNKDVVEIIHDDDFCDYEQHCSNEDYTECWKRFFDNYKQFKESD